MARALALLVLALLIGCAESPPPPEPVALAPVQPELFGDHGAQPLAWADFDNDGDLDLYVGFRYTPNRLYENDDGVFRDVAPEVGLDVAEVTGFQQPH